MIAALALAGCGSATRTESPSGEAQQKQQKLVVWDWKSGEPVAAAYIEQAKADFARRHPGVTVEFVAQPFDQYYTLLGTAIQAGKGPDVMLFNGGGQIRDRAGALLPLDRYVAEDRSRLAGWDAFSKDGKVYAAPVTLQGHPIYYNKALYEQAGLDPATPPRTWSEFLSGCAAIKKATGAACFALGNKEGFGIQFFLSGLGSGVLTPQEYDDWIAGKRDWASPGVKRIFELWKDAGDKGLNNDGANSTAMFTDVFRVFETGKAAHIIGLMSDIGHWNDFKEFLPPDKIGVMQAPVVTDGATPASRTTAASATRSRSGRRPRPGRRPGAVPDLDRRPDGVLRQGRRDRVRHDDRRLAGRPGRRHDRLRDQDRQARPARGTVLQDPRRDGQAVPAAPQRVDHRGQGAGAAGRLRPEGLTACGSRGRRSARRAPSAWRPMSWSPLPY
ncbi:ABC transporter substrate-binding protein [Nonomuraea rubra]|uniref:ABC transporter substrate-binding protein n=1 Tax=Nonomuraea rubra TaxID=46180 RepID=UPI0036145E56